LSSSQNFGTEVRTLLGTRSSHSVSPEFPVKSPRNKETSKSLTQSTANIRSWPTETEAQGLLETFNLQVSTSQHFFDARIFYDHLATFYHDTSRNESSITDLWFVEVLMVFAIGKQLQSTTENEAEAAGEEFYSEALKRIPGLSQLRSHGTLGVEVMGLMAAYLQVADRKVDAYLYVSCETFQTYPAYDSPPGNCRTPIGNFS
jgi:proline utilization trans-activator